VETEKKTEKKLPQGLTKLNITGLGLSELKQDEPELKEEKPKVRMPPLKVEGLGLSEIKNEVPQA